MTPRSMALRALVGLTLLAPACPALVGGAAEPLGLPREAEGPSRGRSSPVLTHTPRGRRAVRTGYT